MLMNLQPRLHLGTPLGIQLIEKCTS